MKRKIVFLTIALAVSLILGGSMLQSMDQGRTGAQAARLDALLALSWEEDFSADLPPDTYYVTSTEGSGIVDGGSFLLTQNAPSQRGRIFNLTPFTMDEFGASFRLFLGNNPYGADGAAFIFCPSYNYTPDTDGTLDASCPGGYIVGFDNWEWDGIFLPDRVYVAYGSHANRLTQVDVPELATGSWHEAYVGLDEGAITVTLDGVRIIDEFPIPDYTQFPGYFGFSAATGASINEHRVDDIQVYPEARFGQLDGYVYGEDWGETIAGATVIGDNADGSSWSTVTGSNGYYSMWVPAGSYTVTAEHPLYFSESIPEVEVLDNEFTSVNIGLSPKLTIEPDMLESWLIAGTEELTHPTGLVITNQGDATVDYQLFDGETTVLGDETSSIASLSGSFVVFDPSAGGDFNYFPGTSQTFCLRAESYTDDGEWVWNVFERFPSDWEVSNVYVQGTPTCDNGGTFDDINFSWEYHLGLNEINIYHPRLPAGSDHCVATYCFDVTSGAGPGDALVSWYWGGDSWYGEPHFICSSDGYTPEGATTCQEALQPQAVVPIVPDSPWVWEEPLNGSLAPGEVLQVEVSFSAVVTDPLPLGDYSTRIGVLARTDPMAYYQPFPEVGVMMHVVEAFSDPLPSFESNAPVYPGNTVILTNTSQEGLPPTEYYVWDFGDGTTVTNPTTGPVRHSYSEAGTYTVTLTAHQAQTGMEANYSADIEVMGFDFLTTEPTILESWLVAGTEELTHPTGLVITNQGDTTVDFQLYDWEPTVLGDEGASIASLSGSFVVFDPSGGDPFYIPGASQTFCLRVESYTDDWEWVENVYERFPGDWTVSDVYLQGTPTCDNGGIFEDLIFSWEHHLGHPNEINISHLRIQNPIDHCVATYCFEVTSGAGPGNALVSWYWKGDTYESTPHYICSDDGYTPEEAIACEEALQPQAVVPILPDSPWVWQDPLSGTISPGEVLQVEVSFSADALALGDYFSTLGILARYEPITNFGLAREIEVIMHVVETFSDPQPSFESNATVRSGETLIFTNTSEEGVPSTEFYEWDFGDGTTVIEPTAGPVSHVYTAEGSYTVTLTAHQAQTDVEVEYTEVIEVIDEYQIFLPALLNE
jgi:PKD repeat protein